MHTLIVQLICADNSQCQAAEILCYRENSPKRVSIFRIDNDKQEWSPCAVSFFLFFFFLMKTLCACLWAL